MAVVPSIIGNMPNEKIEEYANSPNTEDDVLKSLGLKNYQIETVKRTGRWRKYWDMGKSKFVIDHNKTLANSEEPTIQKLVAEHTLPKIDDTPDEWNIEIDAPKWFREKQHKGKRGEKAKS